MRINLIPYPIRKPLAEILTPPTKLSYKVREIFDPAGMVIRVTNFDGTVEDYDEFDYDSNLFTPFVADDTKQILVITVNGFSLTLEQDITIIE